MTEFIKGFVTTFSGNNVILATLLLAMVPIFELRGAIPFGMAYSAWGTEALSSWEAYGCGLLGSCVIVPILALILIPIINWLKNTKTCKHIALKFEKKIKAKSKNIETTFKIDEKTQSQKSKKAIWLKMLGVFVFVGVPIPFTGVWSGTCIAIFLGLNFWQTCVSVILGNIVAGFIILLFSILAVGYTTMSVFYTFSCIALGLLTIAGIKALIAKVQLKNKQKAELKKQQQVAKIEEELEIENN